MKILPLALAVLAGVNYSSQALTVTGGDFGPGSATGDILDVPNFFESSIASYNYNDYTTGHPDHFSVNTTRKLALDWGVDGYVYQDLGLWEGEASVTLTADSLIRNALFDSRYGRLRDRTDMGTCDWSVWDMSPAAVGANGTKPLGLGGVLLDSFFLDATTLTYTADTSTFLHTYNISGASAGDHIWLMIEKNSTPGANAYLGAEYEVLFDNVSVVPEPTSVALFGMAAAAGVIFRRRKA